MFKKSLFRGTHTGQLSRASGFTSTGEPLVASVGSIRFRPIRLSTNLQETSIRTDRSGSQARADEETFQGRILVEPNADIRIDDRFEYQGKTYRVVEVFPRYTSMDGLLDHYQVDLTL